MSFTFEYSKRFLKNLKDIKKGDQKRIRQINSIVKKIKVEPSDLP